MPPRIPLPIRHARLIRPTRLLGPRSTALRSFSATHTPQASILGSLSDVPSSYNKRIRRGRGPASGKGKTSGRGHKGQKQHGKVPRGFQGGQVPVAVAKGLRGTTNNFAQHLTTINLDRIAEWISAGRLDPRLPITVKELEKSRCTHGIKDGIKLLARDAECLQTPIHIVVSRASSSAITAVERAGGTVTTRYYTKAGIRRILKSEMHPILSLMTTPSSTAVDGQGEGEAERQSEEAPQMRTTSPVLELAAQYLPHPSKYRYRLPDATSRRDMEYYRDPAHRGYLSWQVAKGQGPSLFFKTPVEIATNAQNAKNKPKKAAAPGFKEAGRLW